MTAAAKLINGDMLHCRQTEKNNKRANCISHDNNISTNKGVHEATKLMQMPNSVIKECGCYALTHLILVKLVELACAAD